MKTVLAIIILAGVAVAIYFIARPSSEERAVRQTTEQEISSETKGESTEGKKMAFSELIKQKGTYKCDVNINVGETTTIGTMYLDGDNIRGEYSMAVQGTTFDAFFISDGEFAYAWSSMAPQGVKMPITTATTTTATSQQVLDYNQIGDYDCQPWKADASKFAVPTTVTFTTINN